MLGHVASWEIAASQADQSYEDLEVPTRGQIIINISVIDALC